MVAKKVYDPGKIEKKWGQSWQKNGIYEVDLEKAKNPFYNLMMFPYPSAEGLHVGNMYAFTGADIYGRYQRMQGKDVFESIGLDGFGIHSENYAMKVGRHPKEHAKISERHFYEQLSMIGNGYAWSHRIETYNPAYYKWTQWLFTKMFEKGLAYKGKAQVNWCPSCKTVLADEQVEGGVCERCKSEAERKEMESWYFKITDYADRLLENIEKINWPEPIKTAQRNWIGRKEGINIEYEVEGSKEKVTCFTTRPDTNFGAMFVVVAPEHELVGKIIESKLGIGKKELEEVRRYREVALRKTEQQRLVEEKKKTGVFTGLYAINQLNDYKMPIYVADFVLAGFGTGAVVGVPGHDKRDFEFAMAFDLPVKRVVVADDGDESEIVEVSAVQEEEGKMINSEFLDGLDIYEATVKMMDYLEEKGWGKRVVSFHLRDWLISRQRYWGAPIPMVKCDKCGWQELKESDLPLELPDMKDFEPEGTGKGPLAKLDEWKRIKCSKCGGWAERETDICDTFIDSSWYYLGYPFIKDGKWDGDAKPFRRETLKKWLPVDAYIGGAEHAVLHLLYSRFVTMALNDWGYVDFDEPFPFLYSHGLLIKDGMKMSKSKGNVINPDEYIERFGADALRCYLMFLGPYNQGGDFRDTGMAGMYKWLERVWKLFGDEAKFGEKTAESLKRKLHGTIKKVGEDMRNLRYNTAIAALMELVNEWKKDDVVMRRSDGVSLLKLLAPLTPFMAEELYQKIREGKNKVDFGKQDSIHWQRWPTYDEKFLIQERIEIAVQENGKLRETLEIETGKVDDREFVLGEVKKLERIVKILEGKKLVKEVYVPGRVVNLVVG